jgi:hypothetical protein
MTDLRENSGWVIGSIATAIAMAVGWLTSSGVVVNLLFLLLGSGITYVVQTRTQKRVWKREYALRNTETVYGPLFQDADNRMTYIEESIPQQVFFIKWDEIKRTYQYLTIDEEFRNRLDRFAQKTWNYSTRFQKIRQLAQDIAVEETQFAFPSFKNVYPQFVIKTEREEGHHHINESLIRQEHPYTSALKNKKEEKHEYFIALNPIQSGQTSVLKYEDEVKAIFDAMWDKCHQRMEQNSDVQAIRKEYPEIIKELQSIRKELIRRIQEPWKI